MDKNAKLFVDLTKTLSISNDDFIRTTELKHKKAAEKFWLACMEKKDIYKKNLHRPLLCWLRGFCYRKRSNQRQMS